MRAFRFDWRGTRHRVPSFFGLAVWLAVALAPPRIAAAEMTVSLPPGVVSDQEPAAILPGAPLQGAASAAGGLSCNDAAAQAESEAGLPAGLLAAIGRVESGRYDPGAGRIVPWPWAINQAGAGRFFAAKDDAVAYVRGQQLAGVQSIDVGCFQVNLYYHPNAFATIEDAFDPLTNARYAASFLSQLYAQSGGWDSAVALYHSAMPAEGEWYRGRVLASWHNGGLGGDLSVSPAPRGYTAGSRNPILQAARPRAADPYVVLISARASGVRVWMPAAAGPEPGRAEAVPPQRHWARTTMADANVVRHGGAHLPRVIIPSGLLR